MAKIPVTLGEFKYSSKKEATSYYSDILNKNELDQPLEGEDFSAVMALLLNHPIVKEKIGLGVKSLIVRQGYNADNRCFHVVRNDGTIEDFSIGKCINGDHSTFLKFSIACRRAVDEEVANFKNNYFKDNADANKKVSCQIGGEKILYSEAHVDHAEPYTFSYIVQLFIQENGIDLNAVEYITYSKYGNEFYDPKLVESFRKWHWESANLRIIAEKRNREKAYLGWIKKGEK